MKKILLVIISFVYLFAIPVFAIDCPKGGTANTLEECTTSLPTLDNPLGDNIQDIPALVEAILDIALTIGVPIIALAIIYAGFKFIAAQGNKEKLQEAKQTILYVVIGAAILLAAYAIATAIVGTISAIRE